MSVKTGQTVDNINLKFLELKKYLISSEDINGFDTISVDNNQSILFVLNGNKIFVIKLNDLLAFEWNKSVVNEICDTFHHFPIDLNFKPHLVSVSGRGFGNKLAVCGADGQNQSPFILFYDLNGIYTNREKSSPYSRINLVNSCGLVSELVWHSEFSDNQFGCCLTDGSLFIISIGDIETKMTTILSHLPSNYNSMSLCWSPKGKQLVIGHKNGYFSQYKLVNGQQIQEVKKIGLIEPFNDFNVISIKWIVSSLFAVAIAKDSSDSEKDVHILLVSTPSKAMPQYVDFGSICLDNFDAEGYYKINLYHFNNLILCATTMSSEVAIIGCDFDKDSADLDNWSQWVLDDSSRIDLPMDSDGNETYFRGIVVSKGTQNIYRLNSNESYGGMNCPLLFVYNSAGILVPFLIIDKTGHLKAIVPPSIAKLTTPAPTPAIPQQKQMTSTPILSSKTETRPNADQKLASFGTPLASQTPVVSSQPRFEPKLTPLQTPESSSQTPVPNQQFTAQTPIETPSQKLSGDEKDTTTVANELYISAIRDQINEFNKLMNETKKKFSKIDYKIGDNDEKLKLKTNSRLIEEVLKELKDNFKGTSKDISILQSSLIESFALLEEARSIMDRNVDPKYRSLLRQRALDPITERRLKEILALNQYIETQLRELDIKFEQEWYEWLETKKALKSKQPNRIRPNTNLDLIYKAINNNQRVINVLKHQMTAMNQLVSPEKNKDKQIIDKLANNLNKYSLNDIEDELDNEVIFKLKIVSDKKRNNLKEFFENRPKVPFIRPLENTSRFISAIEMIKEKQRSVERSRLLSESMANKSINTSPTAIKSMDNKVDIIPTVVSTPKVEKSVSMAKSVEKITTVSQLPQMNISMSKTTPPKVTSSSVSIITPISSIKPIGSFQTTQQTPPFRGAPPLGTPRTIPSSTPGPSFGQIYAPRQSTPSSIQTSFTIKPQPSVASVVTTTTISLSNIPKTEPNKKSELQAKEGDTSTSSSKSVSFGNTTIINPSNDAIDEQKLDTISEISETGDNISVTDSPFASFKGFGGFAGNTPKDSIPKLSFNLNKSTPNSSFSFNSSLNKLSESQPKYEDITPPSSPIKTIPSKEEKKENVSSSSDVQTSITSSILKTTLSTKTNTNQSENKPQETSLLRSLITGSKTETTTVTPTIFSNPVSTSISTSTPQTVSLSPTTFTTQSTTALTLSSGSANKPSTDSTAQKTQTLAFGSAPALGQTTQSPFSGGFSFGNTSPGSQPFQSTGGQSLSFGFGSTNTPSTQSSVSPSAQTPTTTAPSTGLSFGQQSSAVNNLSFCNLGGPPNPENAQKNVFGGAFSSPPLQTAAKPPTFGSTAQTSPFNMPKTTASGIFGSSGSFSSGTIGVAQTGFGAFASQQQQSPQQTQPVFGGSPMFGGAPKPAFGGSPTFGGSPQPAFGSAPAFGAPPAIGAMGASTFGGTQSTATFGANTPFGAAANSGLSFGALASSAQTSTNPTPFGGGFTGFPQNSDSFSFTQRRK